MGVTLYGIPNCDTVKKARRWLDERGVEYRFHDFKKEGVEAAQIERWFDAAGWERVLNRAGTTFRKLSDAEKQGLDRGKALALLLAQPSMIKRPVIEWDDATLVGFKPEEYERLAVRSPA